MFIFLMTGLVVIPITIGIPLLFPKLLQHIRDGKTVEAGKDLSNICMCILLSQYGFWGMFTDIFLSK